MTQGTNQRRPWWIAGLLLLAFAARFAPALAPHFWYDEICTVAMVHNSPHRLLETTAHDVHPPLYYYWVKCFAAAGRRLGGPFATLAWLRLASILPGMLACWLAWWLARRQWGARAALGSLALFAVSPALVYYSIELRNYASVHALLLIALAGFMEAVAPGGTRPRLGVALFVLAVIAAFYAHTLSALYVGGFGLIWLIELARQPARRGALLRRGAAAGALIALGWSPWFPYLEPQAGVIHNIADWLNWAALRDLPLTFFWHLPLGPWIGAPVLDTAWVWPVMALTAAFMIALAYYAQLTTHNSQLTTHHSRLLLYCAVLTVAPLLAAFFLSYFRIAKVFMNTRYNLIAAPFFNLALIGLIYGLRRPRLRAGALSAVLIVSALSTAVQVPRRIAQGQDIARIARHLRPEIARPGTQICWITPAVLPWLGRCGPFRLGSFEDALARPEAARGDTWLIAHQAAGLFSGSSYSTGLLDYLLKQRGITREPIELWGWEGFWRLNPAQLATLAADYRYALQTVEKARRAIPGGQRLLADDPAFREGWGWSAVYFENNPIPQCWTEGSYQRVEWAGPARPGAYQLKMIFWRAHPYPAPEITLRHRLPGRAEWTAQRAGMGAVTIAGEVIVRAPGEKLRLEMKTPTWIPEIVIPASKDPRSLGMIFVALELRPK